MVAIYADSVHTRIYKLYPSSLVTYYACILIVRLMRRQHGAYSGSFNQACLLA